MGTVNTLKNYKEEDLSFDCQQQSKDMKWNELRLVCHKPNMLKELTDISS